MLNVSCLKAGYGAGLVLQGIDFDLRAGEAMGLLGRNGMGKTTTLRAIMGLTPPRAGRVILNGTDLAGAEPFTIAQAGIGYVPEGRRIFPTLNVTENLIATSKRNGAWTLERVFDLFPRLAERRSHPGGRLSGGEQQMLAIGRALMTDPRLLILDEATEGLAPLIRQDIWTTLARLKSEGMTLLVVDKSLEALDALADHHVILVKGMTVWRGTPAALQNAPEIIAQHLHL